IVDGVSVLLAKPQTYMNLSEWSTCCLLQAAPKSSGGDVAKWLDQGGRQKSQDGLGWVGSAQNSSCPKMKSVIYHFRGNRELARLRIEMKNVLPAFVKKGPWTREEDELLSSYIAEKEKGSGRPYPRRRDFFVVGRVADSVG
nr:hypothetical protein [Tanacetum cinerariifolium]